MQLLMPHNGAMEAGITRMQTANDVATRQRVDWVDYAKGFCIVFVVMMHSTLGVEQAAGEQGWLHAVVAFAKPFRMPDFFLISGLFLAQVIDRDWRTYLDRKVVHFAYFYLLWTTIQFAAKAPLLLHEHGAAGAGWLYLESFWEPFGTLWFIYLLPIFFVITKLARSAKIPPAAVWLAAAALEIAPIATGSTVIDEFAGWIADVGTMSTIVTLVGVVGALALFWVVRGTALRFLFERPQRFWIAPRKRATLQPAE